MPKFKACYTEVRLDTWYVDCEVEAENIKEARRKLIGQYKEYAINEELKESQIIERTPDLVYIRKIQRS